MKVLQRHEQGIFQIISDPVFEFSLYRENVKAYKDKGNDQDRAAYDHKLSHHSADLHTDAQITDHDKSDDEHPDPY